jgi:hypothetical protein
MQKEQFSICAKCTFDEKPSIFIRDKLTLSNERMLHEDYYSKGSVARKKKFWSSVSRDLAQRRRDRR